MSPLDIKFEQEGSTVFAVAYNTVIGEYEHEELLIAEIAPALGGVMVRFESAFNDPVHCSDLEEAKKTILRDYWKYKPTSLGKNHYIGSDD